MLKELGGLPEGFVLASKADRDLKTGEFSGGQMRRSLERSLKLLGLDRLQLLYLHDPEHIGFEQSMALGGSVDVLRKCQEEGLIEHLGVAGGPIDMMTRFVETDLFEAAISHNRYTLINREADPFWECLFWRTVLQPSTPHRMEAAYWQKGRQIIHVICTGVASDEILQRAFKMEELCQHYNVPLAAVALQFSLRDPRISSTVVGITQSERLYQTVELASQQIPDQLWQEIGTI